MTYLDICSTRENRVRLAQFCAAQVMFGIIMTRHAIYKDWENTNYRTRTHKCYMDTGPTEFYELTTDPQRHPAARMAQRLPAPQSAQEARPCQSLGSPPRRLPLYPPHHLRHPPPYHPPRRPSEQQLV